MQDKEIISLVRLLEDDNSIVSGIVVKKLLEKGGDAIPDLEKAWEHSMIPSVQNKIEEIVHQIQFSKLKNEFREWSEGEAKDLLYGAFLVARYQYPDLKYSDMESEIDAISQKVWLEFHDNLTALEKIRIINHIFFEVYKFTGNKSNFFSPGNSYINQVLRSKKGNPVSLAVLYAAVAGKMDLPVYGVNLPLNYILAYVAPSYAEDPDNILFYINPYNRGNLLSRKEIDFFLHEQKLEPKPEYYVPCANKVSVERILKNLLFSYEKMENSMKVSEIKELIAILHIPEY